MEYLIVIMAMLLGGIIQGSCGFGAALICMSIISLTIDYKIALPVMYLASIALNGRIIIKAHRHVIWKIILIPLIASLAGRLMGLYLFNSLNSAGLKLILGFIIIAVALFQLLFKKGIIIKPKPIIGAFVGVISGVFGGIASVGGPPLVVYYVNMNLSKEEYMANLQILFFFGTLFSISLLAVSGGYNLDIIPLGITAIIAILAGAQIGLKIFDRINRERVTRMVNLVLIIMGLSYVVHYFLSS
jgi:uncharacterized protein